MSNPRGDAVRCEQALERFVAALAGEPPDGGELAVESHLATCAACRDTATELETTWKRLGAIPDVEPGPQGRLRFEAMLAAWQDAHAAARRHPEGLRQRLRRRLRILTPTPAWAAAAAAAAVAFAAGMWLAGRSSEMHALRQDLQATRSILVISLLQQSSPASRLQGIAYSAGVDSPDPQVVELLFETLDHDTSVDVRLAAVDALAAVRGDASVGRRLTASLATQSSPLVQIGIVDALVHRRESSARATLQQMSESSRVNREVREHAKWAMGQLTL